MVSAVKQVLSRLRKAKSRDEGDDYADELAKSSATERQPLSISA
jgi:hypothetical protein